MVGVYEKSGSINVTAIVYYSLKTLKSFLLVYFECFCVTQNQYYPTFTHSFIQD